MKTQLFCVFLLLVANSQAQQICGNLCDNDDSNRANNPRVAHTETLFGREIAVLVSDADNVGFARISNGDPGDEVWVDRSFNGGRDWQGRIGNAAIATNSRTAQTPVFNLDGDVTQQQVGVLRACGKAGDRTEIVCTPWYRTTYRSSYPAEAAATTLMMYYNQGGLWDLTGWWNSANALTALIDFMRVTGDRTYLYAVDNTFEKNKNSYQGSYRNDFLDDTAWWGLAWIDAFDLTGNQKYLQMAQTTADFIATYIDDHCNGGVYWSAEKNYKNAITNELYIKLAAALHNRLSGDSKYLNSAVSVWRWFDASGMINGGHQINDGLDQNTCKNNNGLTWTYNQGVILGAFVELQRATGDNTYLDRARQIADATVNSNYLNPQGVLHEPCDHDAIDCGGDAPTFKGVFARNLGELNSALSDHPYNDYITRNKNSIVSKAGNSFNAYGLHYEGPYEYFSSASHVSAFEMLTAYERVVRF